MFGVHELMGSYKVTQKLLLLKNCLRLRYGKEHHFVDVQRAQDHLLAIQRLLHDHLDNEELRLLLAI